MIDKNDLDDIFGIPQDGSHLDDDSGSTDDVAFGNVVAQSGNKTFEDQVKILIKDTNEVAKSEDEIIKDSKIKKDKKESGGNGDELQNEKINQSAQANGQDTSSVHSAANNQVLAESTKLLGDELHARGRVHKSEVDNSIQSNASQAQVIIKITGWNTSTKDLLFISFYEMKKDALSGWLLPGGEINFINTQEELVHARVDLSTIEFGDLHAMFDALKGVQHWKDRVTEISLRVNAQYYSWKRAIDLFRGTLARMHYEKPAEKQDGVVMEHMGDMIRYFSQLESLHANVDAVVRNLDNAFDCISRQITVSLPQGHKDSDTVEKRVSKNASISPGSADNFADIMQAADRLPSAKNFGLKNNNASSSKKIGTVNWNEI
jgi:hypothetical protein